MTRSPATPYRAAAALVTGGLFVQVFTLAWPHPMAFLVFALLGGTLVGAGVLAFAWAALQAGDGRT